MPNCSWGAMERENVLVRCRLWWRGAVCAAFARRRLLRWGVVAVFFVALWSSDSGEGATTEKYQEGGNVLGELTKSESPKENPGDFFPITELQTSSTHRVSPSASEKPVLTVEEGIRRRHMGLVQELSVELQDAFAQVEAGAGMCMSLPEPSRQAVLSRFAETFEFEQLVSVYDASEATVTVERSRKAVGDAVDTLANSLEKWKTHLRLKLLPKTSDEDENNSTVGLGPVVEGFTRVTTALSRALHEAVEKAPEQGARLKRLTRGLLPTLMENIMMCVMVLQKEVSVSTVTLLLRVQRFVRLLKDFGAALMSTVKGQQRKTLTLPSKRSQTSYRKRGKLLDAKTVLSFFLGAVATIVTLMIAVPNDDGP